MEIFRQFIRSATRLVIRLFIMGFLLTLAVGGFLIYDYQRFLKTPVVTDASPAVYRIQSGDSIASLARKLPQQHLPLAKDSPLSSYIAPYYFRYLAKQTHTAHRLKMGDYRLQKGMTASELLQLFTQGKTIVYKVQFIEGKTFKQLRQTLADNAHLQHRSALMSAQEILKAVGEKNLTHPEGLFFPDTYQFHNGSQDITVLKQAYTLMQQQLASAWVARDPDNQLKTPYELLILASIIEKETGVNSERNKVSGVFHRRLAKNMLLQTDPTVIYGLGDKYDGSIYKTDLQLDTPYNTYLHKGLPPTPIAMPSMASLMAAGQPDKGNALFFVADGNGGHLFSDTYEAHKKAVKIYRDRLKARNQQPEVNSKKDQVRPEN